MATFILLFQGGIANFSGLLLPLMIVAVFYFLIILPQKKRQRELQETVAQLKAGDRIITTSGIIGTITVARDATLLIRSADKTILEITRSAVAGLQSDEEAK
ncbi:MAG: preprotein translocase subunit YajC [Pyrinomonadaceae bacterium]